MTHNLAWTLGLTAAGAAVVGGLVYAASKQSAPAGGPVKALCPQPGTVTGRPAVQLIVDYSKTGTTLQAFVGDSLRVNLLQSPTGQNWALDTSDDSVADITKVTTDADPKVPGGTDSVFLLALKSSGAVTLSGQSGGQTFTLRLSVCSG